MAAASTSIVNTSIVVDVGVGAALSMSEKECNLIRPGSPSRLDRVGWVYFLEAAEVKRIKIGFSGDPAFRAEGFLTGSPVDLEIIAVILGTEALERRIQRAFDAVCWKREWFRDTPRLRRFIRDMAVSPAALDDAARADVPGISRAAHAKMMAGWVEEYLVANPVAGDLG